VKRGIEAEEIRRQSCLANPNPSVIITNQVIGAMMANEARTVLAPEHFGEALNGVLKYTTNLASRWGYNRIEDACSCEAKSLEISVPDPKPKEKKALKVKVYNGNKT
jgi:hypothetical protein